MKLLSRLWPAVAALVWCAVWPMHAIAQGYPAKPVRIVVPYSTGGSADFVARVMAQKLSELWSQQVVVDNRPGANGNIGVEQVARSQADGYTLLLASEIQFVINPALFAKLTYDLARDFEPVTLITVAVNVLIANPSVAANNVTELIALARANPGKINYASPGTASPNHLSMELLQRLAGVSMTHIPYKGAGQAVPDIIAGQVQIMFNGIPQTLTQLAAGRIKALAVGSQQRLAALPNVPTVAEAGFPGFESAVAWSLFAPAGTPRDVINRVQGDVAKLLGQADLRERFVTAGLTPIGSTPAELTARLSADRDRWPRLIREAGIKAE
ncbi:MAG: tripartite tricarboxylate transporter substrate binding protein [Betaproteobacteria bacterium]|nr:tripartite tricarboxylate transporter substrate binding protein [Betaproteobacteria bacterium]